MLKLLLKRIFKGPLYTIGHLYLNGKYFCDTLEDVDRGLINTMSEFEIKSKKVKHETAIPYGTYEVTLQFTSPKYSNFNKYKWARFTKGKIPRLLDVKGFEGILIHVGNSRKDTSGCILVGYNKEKGKVLYSTDTFKRLYALLEDASSKGDKINITIE